MDASQDQSPVFSTPSQYSVEGSSA